MSTEDTSAVNPYAILNAMERVMKTLSDRIITGHDTEGDLDSYTDLTASYASIFETIVHAADSMPDDEEDDKH